MILSEPLYTFVEGSPPSDVCISITNNVTIDTEVSLLLNLRTEEGTATLLDFELNNSELLIPGSMCFSDIITITSPDNLLEANETFSIAITPRDPQLAVAPAETSRADILIIDTDSELLQLAHVLNSISISIIPQ